MNGNAGAGGAGGPAGGWYAAHELFTCLNAIRGTSELLLAGAAGPLTAEGLGAVTTIADAARTLETHLRHCQAVDRLRAERRPRPRPVGLDELLSDVVAHRAPPVAVLAVPEDIRAAFALVGPRERPLPWTLHLVERRRSLLVRAEDGEEVSRPAIDGIRRTLVWLHLHRGGCRPLAIGDGGLCFLLRKVREDS